MDIILNGTKWIGFEPNDDGLKDLIEVSGQPEIDVKNAWNAAMSNVRSKEVSNECRRRIYAAASSETQMNMATAAALISAKAEGDRSAEETEILSGLNDAIGWVGDMRAAYQSISADPEADIYDDASWPPFPDGARDLVAKF